MSKAMKWGVGVVVGLIGLGALAFVPSTMHIERSLHMQASPEAVYAQVVDVELAQGWSPWAAADPSMEISYGDAKQGVGASYSWTSDEQGSGTLTIIEAEPFRSIRNDLDFGEQGGGVGTWRFESDGEGTNTTWMMDGEGPLLFTLVADRLVGPMFEDGLARLKTQAEQWTPPEPEPAKEAAVQEAPDEQNAQDEAESGEAPPAP